jgi:hypothetical protein
MIQKSSPKVSWNNNIQKDIMIVTEIESSGTIVSNHIAFNILNIRVRSLSLSSALRTVLVASTSASRRTTVSRVGGGLGGRRV